MSHLPQIEVKFTGPAEAEVAAMKKTETENEDPKQWHIKKVREFAAAHTSELPGVTVGRVRKAAHPGGTDSKEPDHITVSYKAKNKDIPSPKGGAWHVYTGRTNTTSHDSSSSTTDTGHTGGGAGTGK